MVRSLRLFTIASISIFAIGVGISQQRQMTSSSRVKPVEAYWQETGLESQTLEDLFTSSLCYTSEKHFLACINSLQRAGEKANLYLVGENTFKSLNQRVKNQTEREYLLSWSHFYKTRFEDAVSFDFLGTWQQLKNHLPQESLLMAIGAGLNGFLAVMKDPHTYLVPLNYYKEVLSQNKSKSNVLGLTLSKSPAGEVFIKKVLPKSLAEKSGLRKNDFIFSINGKELHGLSMTAVSELMKGPEGTEVHFEVQRGSKTIKIAIIKVSQVLPTASGQIAENDPRVGRIVITRFAKNTCQEFKSELRELMDKGIRGLMLDLRDNPGGQMDEAACVVSLLAGVDKKVFELRYLDTTKDVESYYGSEEAIFHGPVAILINRGSASAAEIVAGTLRDYGRALLVGERTFGKGSFQEGEVWSQNDKIALFETKGFYYLPSGSSPQLQGLEPDVAVEFKDSSMAQREEDQYLGPLVAPPHVGWLASERTQKLPQQCYSQKASGGDDIEASIAQESLFCLLASSGENVR
ncbi:MAG: S41 family peptidase [Bdellovibrionia bacterium]